jgi:uncharacterized membrane protein
MSEYRQNLDAARNYARSNNPRNNNRIERGVQEHTYPPNYRPPSSSMDEVQRWVSGVGGAAVLFYGLRQDNISRWPLAALGAGLIYQGVSGNNWLDYLPIGEDTPSKESMAGEEPFSPSELRIRKSVTVNRPAEELYAYWRKLDNLPTFMNHVKSVQETSSDESHWIVNVLHGIQLEWDAHITVDRPNEMIGWETMPGSSLRSLGYVKFIPTSRGTEVSLSMDYSLPGGPAGTLAGRAVKFIAAGQIKDEIRNFKALMEAGEIPTTEGQSSARPADRRKAQEQPAQMSMNS